MINILDPDVIVIGGGVSMLEHIYQEIPWQKAPWAQVFGGEASTPILPAKFGDSSGVRGAAWFWPINDAAGVRNGSPGVRLAILYKGLA